MSIKHELSLTWTRTRYCVVKIGFQINRNRAKFLVSSATVFLINVLILSNTQLYAYTDYVYLEWAKIISSSQPLVRYVFYRTLYLVILLYLSNILDSVVQYVIPITNRLWSTANQRHLYVKYRLIHDNSTTTS